MTDSLLETELFGHEKGAFTGAERRRVGKFELADRGTLFLDEIGTISPMMQVKILRALQEGEITRVGGNENIKVDIRVICATNADLAAEVDKGTFREDLYYRINVVPMTLPPLRERPGDIALLADHYLKQFNGVIGKGLRGFTDEALATMRQYAWPGNVRELRNLIERAVILSRGPMIERIDVPNAAPVPLTLGPAIAINVSVGLKDVVADAEKAYLGKLLAECHGNIGETAERAGVNTRTIHRKMQEFDIRKENFK
jgi:DNA-binding NtrC family response regulator